MAARNRLKKQRKPVNYRSFFKKAARLAGGFTVFFVVALLLSFVALWTPWKLTGQAPVLETTAAIGNGLLGKWLLPFEIASVVLIATMVGAIVVARKEVKLD